MDAKALLIGALTVAVIVLAYLYYESRRTAVEVDIGAVPGHDRTASLTIPS